MKQPFVFSALLISVLLLAGCASKEMATRTQPVQTASAQQSNPSAVNLSTEQSAQTESTGGEMSVDAALNYCYSKAKECSRGSPMVEDNMRGGCDSMNYVTGNATRIIGYADEACSNLQKR